MLKLLAVSTVSLALSLAGTASAEVPPPSIQLQAVAAAVSYWGGYPTDACNGQPPVVTYEPLDPTIGGEATIGACLISINSNVSWYWPGGGPDGGWHDLCIAFIHEWGHLMLGADAFPDNTADPAHSLDPNNIMYGGGAYQLDPAVCAPLDYQQPPPPPPSSHPHHRHHHHRRHHHRHHRQTRFHTNLQL